MKINFETFDEQIKAIDKLKTQKIKRFKVVTIGNTDKGYIEVRQ